MLQTMCLLSRAMGVRLPHSLLYVHQQSWHSRHSRVVDIETAGVCLCCACRATLRVANMLAGQTPAFVGPLKLDDGLHAAVLAHGRLRQ